MATPNAPWRRWTRPFKALRIGVHVAVVGFFAILGSRLQSHEWASYALLLGGMSALLLLNREEQRRANRDFNSAVGTNFGNLPPDEKVLLYLRSFEDERRASWKLWMKGLLLLPFQILLGRAIASTGLSIADPYRTDTESRLAKAFSPFMTLIAIGDKYFTMGAVKLAVSDEAWRDAFANLCTRSEAIFCFVGTTTSAKWEVETIAGHPAWREKVFIILPPDNAIDEFRALKDHYAAKGIALPDYDEDGWVSSMAQPGESPRRYGYKDFMWTVDTHARGITLTPLPLPQAI